LADYGTDETSFPFAGHDQHKLSQIRNILDTYHALPFILIGDSGQRDRAIYQQINEEYPGRILAIYIRDVEWLTRDAGETTATVDELAHGVEMVLTPNTRAAALHAAAKGLIASADLDRIHADAAFDTGEPGAAERLAAEPPLANPPT
jgi:phosphatidate phosphatase APP1